MTREEFIKEITNKNYPVDMLILDIKYGPWAVYTNGKVEQLKLQRQL